MHGARQMGFPQAPELARIVHAPRSRGRESAHSHFLGNQRLLTSPARGACRCTLTTCGNKDVGGSHNAVRPGPGPSHDRTHRRHARIALLLALAFCLLNAGRVHAGDEIERAGDVLQYALPATAVGLTLGYKDGKGALQLGVSMAVTLGVTYVLKYAVDSERRQIPVLLRAGRRQALRRPSARCHTVRGSRSDYGHDGGGRGQGRGHRPSGQPEQHRGRDVRQHQGGTVIINPAD